MDKMIVLGNRSVTCLNCYSIGYCGKDLALLVEIYIMAWLNRMNI